MRKCLLLFILTTCSQVGFAQFTDYFMDRDFTNKPVCEGASENGAKLKTGMYVIFMQVLSEYGKVESYKKIIVLHN